MYTVGYNLINNAYYGRCIASRETCENFHPMRWRKTHREIPSRLPADSQHKIRIFQYSCEKNLGKFPLILHFFPILTKRTLSFELTLNNDVPISTKANFLIFLSWSMPDRIVVREESSWFFIENVSLHIFIRNARIYLFDFEYFIRRFFFPNIRSFRHNFHIAGEILVFIRGVEHIFY